MRSGGEGERRGEGKILHVTYAIRDKSSIVQRNIVIVHSTELDQKLERGSVQSIATFKSIVHI